MRKKSNIASGSATPPEAFPSVLQDALYTDDYELQMMELQAFEHLINRAKTWDEQLKKTREAFAAAGGKVTEEQDGLAFTLNGQGAFFSDETFKVHYRVKGSKEDRVMIMAAIRAHVCEFLPRQAIDSLTGGMHRLLNMHLVRGSKKVADEAMKNASTLDELARGQIIWDDENA